MNTTYQPPLNSENLFSDVASIDVFIKVAAYFGIDYDAVFSVYHTGPNRYEGEVALFTRRDAFTFEMLEIEGILYPTKFESVSLSR